MLKRIFSTYDTMENPICVAYNSLNSGQKNPRHTHDFAEFFLITSGSVIHHINDKKVILKERSTQFIFPDDTHHFMAQTSQSCTWINISFPMSILSEDILKMLELLFPSKQTHANSCHILPLTLWDMYINKIELFSNCRDKEQQAIIFRSLLLDLLILYMDFINNRELYVPAWLTKATQQLKSGENYLNSLNWFIGITGKSQSYLNRQMKKYYKMTPTQYINHIRLDVAEDLLMNTNENITEIALKTGFQTIPYFTKVFKEKNNITPSKFRQMQSQISFNYKY